MTYVNGLGDQVKPLTVTVGELSGEPLISPPAKAGTAPAKEQAEGSTDAAESGNGSANGDAKRVDDSANVDAVLLEQRREQIRRANVGPLYVWATDESQSPEGDGTDDMVIGRICC